MLKLYLRWLEGEPVDALLSLNGSDEITDLAALGAFKAPRRTRRAVCRDCGRQQIRQVYEAGEHRLLPCMNCGGSVELQGPPFLSAQLQREWLAEILSRQMAGETAKPSTLMENRLWHLADVTTPRGEVSVVLLRCGWWIDYRSIAKIIREMQKPRTLILTTSRMSHDEVNASGMVVPLITVAKLEPHGLWLERDALIDRYMRGSPMARKLMLHPSVQSDQNLWFELGPDNAWLRVSNRQIRLTGKQRPFVASIARAHMRGLPHKRLADAVNDADYDSDIRSLRQICTRREFRDLIGIADGFVWIRDDVD